MPEIRESFEEAVDDYLACCAEIGKEPQKPFSGKHTLKVSSEMTIPISVKHQLIEHNGRPVAVVVPYDDYLRLVNPELNEPTTPHEVVEKFLGQGKSLVQAWREYLNLTQEEVAQRLGIKQSSYQQIEKKSARPQAATLEKIAFAFDIEPSLLTWTEDE